MDAIIWLENIEFNRSKAALKEDKLNEKNLFFFVQNYQEQITNHHHNHNHHLIEFLKLSKS